MDPVIFLEKVRRPALRGLVRERLDRRTASLVGMDSDSVSLGLVLGPPGSGKTTLLSHIAEAATDASAWYRVGNEDDDEVALTRHLGHTLGAAFGAPALIQAATAGRIPDLVGALDGPAVGTGLLVIDDLHEIAGTPAERALESFLSFRPRKIRIVLGSRRPLRINTSRMLVSGELTEFDGDDLRFRSWEVEQLFRAVYDAPLSPEVAAALTRRTGGWAAGLQLFHLATAHLSRTERERAVDELTGRSRLIRSYLARNVLDGLGRDRRRFLLLTSTLGVLTGDLCDALLNTSGSASVLSELEREQFFTTSTDLGLTYRYHQVLQTHLEVLLVDELGGQAARGVYSRSASLLEQEGRPGAAIRAHARAEDWGSVARLLKPDTAPVGGDDALWGMLSLPGAPTDDPGLVLAGARRLARHGQIAESVAAFRQAEALLDDPEFRRRCTVERCTAAIWLPQSVIPPMPAADETDSSSAMLRLSMELRQITRRVRQPDSSARPLARIVASLAAGDLDAAARQLRSADPDGGTATAAWEPLAARLAARIVDLLIEPDEVAVGQVEEIVLTADVQGWPWLSRFARGLQAAMLLATAPAAWRISAATELLDDLEQRGDRWAFCLTSLVIGAACARIDRPDLAARTLRRTEEVATKLGAPVLGAWASVVRTALAVPQGTPGAEQEAVAAIRGATGLGLSHASVVAETIVQRSRLQPTTMPELIPARPETAAGLTPRQTVLAGISLRCLGGFSLTLSGVELPWRELRPRVRALLMLLAMNHGRQLHRERLVDLLWPDASLTSGIRCLQVAVSAIRQCLSMGGIAEDALRRHGDAYALQLPAVFDQLAEFERLAQPTGRTAGAGPLRSRLEALDLYAGDLLPEVGPAEWVVEERARLRLLAASVGSEAARDALAGGDLRVALGAAMRSVVLDRYHDSSWQLVVEINERLGDHSAAAVARREHARVWADLGLTAPAVPLSPTEDASLVTQRTNRT
jgi:DNA-binding SARP family transcriptional activator/energy-coupling factor transporter ATP-binding protein EcfA2